MDGKRAAIYTRISRDEAGTGQKVEDQEQDCRALAERLGLDVNDDLIFTDNDIAATRASRRGRTRRAGTTCSTPSGPGMWTWCWPPSLSASSGR